MYIFQIDFYIKNYRLNCKLVAVLLIIAIALKAEGQDYKYVYYLDNDLNSTSKAKATIVGKGYVHNGSLILNCFQKHQER